MKVGFWVKLVLGLALIALLLMLGVRLVDALVGFLGKIGGGPAYDEEYVVETPEPAPTMPDYMLDDSFYDNAADMDYED